MQKQNSKAVTLIEILVAILVFSIIMIQAFYTFSAISTGKIRVVGETDIEKESYFFSEKLFQEIKRGGVIDYEEYFNRRVFHHGSGIDDYSVGGSNGLFKNGREFAQTSGFGNYGSGGVFFSTGYGSGLYYCRSLRDAPGTGSLYDENTSTSSVSPGTDFGCRLNGLYSYPIDDNTGTVSTGDTTFPVPTTMNQKGQPQRYGQYYLQFFDYNGNANDDYGDHNVDENIIGDDDDRQLFQGPAAFSGNEVPYLFLISGDGLKRTMFRWKVKADPDYPYYPTNTGCTLYSTGGAFGSGCLGTIQYLKLQGKDRGIKHDGQSYGAFDGQIDTWVIDENFVGPSAIGENVVGSDSYDQYWIDLFSDSIHVKDVKFFLYPNKDAKMVADNTITAPYLRIQYTLTPSRNRKKGINSDIFPELKFSSTINLTELFSTK